MHLNLAKAIRILSTLLALSMVVAGAVRPAQAQSFTSLYTFQGVDSKDGALPSGLVQSTNGFFYGSTGAGGATDAGTVFKFNAMGTETVLWNFDDSMGGDIDGEGTQGLVMGNNGSFYGATDENSGGCSGGSGGNGSCGVVFTITPAGGLSILYKFCTDFSENGVCLDGINPQAAMVQAANGNFYGTTRDGGTYNHGSLFQVTPAGGLSVLHSFCATLHNDYCTDGEPPFSALVQGIDGNLYGTTAYGGASNSGTFFRITTNGTLVTLHSFCSLQNCADGAFPTGGLVQGVDGNLYGTTVGGGVSGGGTFFTITTRGALTTLYSFCTLANCLDGTGPAGLLLATDGNFYGLTSSGGATNNAGTIFQMTPTGALTTLHDFDATDGYGGGTLIQSTSGTLYGTTTYGGYDYLTCGSCNGTVFSLSVGLGPFVETLPTSGKVGAAVKILGSNLTGATSVTFNGTTAAFTVKSKSEITTTVPAGATTGPVKVTVGAHTLASAQTFRVTR